MISNYNEVISSLTKTVENTVKGIAINISTELRDNTPVDTGFCASNWVPTMGAPFSGLAGSRNSHTEVIVDNGPQQSGIDELANYTLDNGDIYITNNTNYIQVLDGGSSQQAPAGFVNTAIDTGINNWI